MFGDAFKAQHWPPPALRHTRNKWLCSVTHGCAWLNSYILYWWQHCTRCEDTLCGYATNGNLRAWMVRIGVPINGTHWACQAAYEIKNDENRRVCAKRERFIGGINRQWRKVVKNISLTTQWQINNRMSLYLCILLRYSPSVYLTQFAKLSFYKKQIKFINAGK